MRAYASHGNKMFHQISLTAITEQNSKMAGIHTDTFVIGGGSVTRDSYVEKRTTVAKEGFNVLGIVGYSLNNQYVFPIEVTMKGSDAVMLVGCISQETQNFNGIVTILYIPA